MSQYTPEQEAAASRVHRALSAERTVIGPTFDDYAEVKGECLLSEWVIVANWIDENNDPWTVTFSSPGLSRTGRIGLLDSHWHD